MSVNNEIQNEGRAATVEKMLPQNGVYASLFDKINLTPVAEMGGLNGFEDNAVMAETSADERVTAAVQVFMQCLHKSGQKVEKLDKTLLDHHIAELDFQISRQLDEVMHNDAFQKVESVWRGLKSLVDKTDFRQNVKLEILDLSKEELRQDFEDSAEIVQSGLYKQTYIAEYDTPGGEPIAAVISAYEFDATAQDVALMRNISKVSAAAHMPFIGSAGPKFFLKESMEEVAAIKDISNYFDRAEYPATFEPGGTDTISQSLLGLVGLGIPGTANHIATPVSRFLALLGVLRQPGKTQEGMQALVTLLAPNTSVKVSPYCLRPVEISQPLGFYANDDFLLDGNTPLGDEAMDANSQLLIALSTNNEQEVQSWKPDGLLYQDFLVMLRVYLGWRFKAKIRLTVSTRLLTPPPLGDGVFWLGMNGVLGAEGDELPEDIPESFTTELGYYSGLQSAIPKQGNRRVTYKFD